MVREEYRPSHMVSLSGQQLKLNTREDGEDVARQIDECEYMHVLDLRGNTLGVEATGPIAKALEFHPELQRALWGDLFTGRLKEEIPRTLKSLTMALMDSGAQLVELDLSDNAIGPMAMPGLKDFLSSNSASNLRVINFNNCGLGIAGKTIAECLIECHENALKHGRQFRLKKFIAGRNRLEQISTKALANAFAKIGTLEEIVMPQNGIKAEGIKALAAAVSANPDLRVLNLNDNSFCRDGAMTMAEAFTNVDQLEVVDFGDCLCRSHGSVAIAEQLRHSRAPLKSLNLTGNEIGYVAARQILERMRQVVGLESLKLGINCFGRQWPELASLRATNIFLDIGHESDDEGTCPSECESEDNSCDTVNDEDDDDE